MVTVENRMKQKIKIPEIVKCAQCGADAKEIFSYGWCLDDMDGYKVMCENKHVATRTCKTANIAIHRWNHRNKLLGSEQ